MKDQAGNSKSRTKTQTDTILRKFKGVVVSDKMTKTIVVKVSRVKTHPKYGKRLQVSRKFHVHDAESQYKVGDKVEIQEVRPLSKTKRWMVIKKIK